MDDMNLNMSLLLMLMTIKKVMSCSSKTMVCNHVELCRMMLNLFPR